MKNDEGESNLKAKSTKVLALVLMLVVAVFALSACSKNGGIKDGTYVSEIVSNQAYTFKGDKMIMSMGISSGMSGASEFKYSYKNSVLSYWEPQNSGFVMSWDCDYDGKSITIYALGREMGAGVTYTRK